LTVLAVGGDGDGFAIGGGHISHAATRNVDITYLLLDNGIYGLTKGQTSPTSAQALKTTTTPYGHSYATVNPLMMLLSYGASWVAQAYAGDPRHLEEMIAQAIRHKGFSYLHILSPCVTFDKTSKTYAKLDQQVRALPEDHDTGDLMAAMGEAARSETPALGLFYQEERPTLGDTMRDIIRKARGNESSGSEASPAK
jgi:2-oxoglutarate ferredoxin oxidoreductase subunit beta